MSAPAVEPATTTRGDPTAVVSRRVVAKIVDEVIRGIPGVIAVIVMISGIRSHTVSDPVAYCDATMSFGHMCVPIPSGNTVWELDLPSLWWTVLTWGLWFVFVWTEGRFGWTPGKLLAGVRVINAVTGEPCGFLKSLIRNILWIVDGFFFGAVALVLALTSAGHRRLGDRAAGTLVVIRAAAGTPPDSAILGDTAKSAPHAGQPVWDPARNLYVLWDPSHAIWLQWNATAGRWEPLRV